MLLPGGVHPGFAAEPKKAKQRWSIDQLFLMPMLCNSVLNRDDLSGILKPTLRRSPAERLAGLSLEQVNRV
jgi:hypothetical protein